MINEVRVRCVMRLAVQVRALETTRHSIYLNMRIQTVIFMTVMRWQVFQRKHGFGLSCSFFFSSSLLFLLLFFFLKSPSSVFHLV